MVTTKIESFAKYAGLATVGVEWLALLSYYLLLPTYFGGQYPISYYAYFPQTRLIFTVCYILAGIFFWIFIRHHLHKYYQAPIKIFTASMILFLALAVVPFDPNNSVSDIIHRILALSSSFFFTIGMYLLAKRAKNKFVYRATITAIVLSFLLLFAFLQSPKESQFIFAFESGSWLVWQIWCIWISFYSYRNNK